MQFYERFITDLPKEERVILAQGFANPVARKLLARMIEHAKEVLQTLDPNKGTPEDFKQEYLRAKADLALLTTLSPALDRLVKEHLPRTEA